MAFHRRKASCIFILFLSLLGALPLAAQGGNAGGIRGTVTDPTGAVIPNAVVVLANNVSGLRRATSTSALGQFDFSNVPFNTYRLSVSAAGFLDLQRSFEVRSVVAVSLNLVLQVAGASQTVTVQAQGNFVENDPTFHEDIDRDAFLKVPLESQSSSLSSLVTLTTPGVTADSNGLFHGLGDHASNSFSVDGQSITDQQSKVFSNQLPLDSVQSLEVISGAPPAEFGGKTSLVIVATTRSGQGVTRPTGNINASYGSFGSSSGGFDLAYGKANWGNFIEIDGLNTGRFLDPPEFTVFHDKGNQLNAFERVDRSFNAANSGHLNLNYTRSWFQTPNAFDNLNVQNVGDGGSLPGGGASFSPGFVDVGNTDQRSRIETFNIAPAYTRIISNDSVWNLGAFVRRDEYSYFPSKDPLADLGPANLQTASIRQYRTLTNAAFHTDVSYEKGPHSLKAGAQYGQTFLRENDALGIVWNLYNSPCTDIVGNSLAGYGSQSDCNGSTSIPNGNYLSELAPYDLTRGGTDYQWSGRADVKELALFVEDQIKAGNWNFNVGIRGDVYNGLGSARQAEPRVGVAYNVKPSSTVLRASYARTLETPFNENLVLSSEGCSDVVLAPLLSCATGVSGVLQPGFRNEFHAGFQQGIKQYVVISGEYIWKYTHNAFDFSVLGNTPITFPINWHNSKIPGYALNVEVPKYHNFSAYVVASSVAARFYGPQVAGAGATGGVAQGANYPFRIDHDEKFNETTHLQYEIPHGSFVKGIWGGLNWRFDSGMVAGSTPCNNSNSSDPNAACPNSTISLPGGTPGIAMVDNNIPPGTNPVTMAPTYLPFTLDQEYQAGFACNGVKADINNPATYIATCPANELTSSLIQIPALGKGDNDRDPPRIQHRNLFDLSLGKDNIFHKEHYKVDLNLTAVNVTNKLALYNFLSTFSGTHYVTPRAMTAKVTLNF